MQRPSLLLGSGCLGRTDRASNDPMPDNPYCQAWFQWQMRATIYKQSDTLFTASNGACSWNGRYDGCRCFTRCRDKTLP